MSKVTYYKDRVIVSVPDDAVNFHIGNNTMTLCLFYEINTKREHIALGDIRYSYGISRKSKIDKYGEKVIIYRRMENE